MPVERECPWCGWAAEESSGRCASCGNALDEHAITTEPGKHPSTSKAIQVGAPKAPAAVADDERMPRGIMRPPHQQGWSRIAYGMLGVAIAADGMQMLAELNKALAMQRLLEGQPLAIDLNRALNQSNFLGIVTILVFVATTAVIMTWLYHAYNNLYVLQVGGLTYTPGEAVRTSLIPWHWPYMPYRVIQELWKASDPTLPAESSDWKERAGSWLIRLWWPLFLLRHLRIQITINPFPADSPALLTLLTVVAWIAAAACFLGIVSAVLFGVIMARIQYRQWRRFDRLQDS